MSYQRILDKTASTNSATWLCLLTNKDSNLNPELQLRSLCTITPWSFDGFEPISLRLITPKICSQDRIRTCNMKLFPITLVITFIPIEWRDYIWHQFRQLTNVFSYFINTSPRTTSASLYQFHLGYVMILLVKRPQSKPVCTPYGTRTRKLSRERGVS